MNLLMEYHKRTDHGRDGASLGSLVCNCHDLFDVHDEDVYDRGYREGYNDGYAETNCTNDDF